MLQMLNFLSFTATDISVLRKMKGALGRVAVIAIAVPLLAVPESLAQTTARADPDAVFEEVVVVARRIEKSEQTVPDLDNLNRDAYRLTALYEPTSWSSNTTVLNYHDLDEHPVVQINQSGAVTSRPTAPANLFYPQAYPQALEAQNSRGQRKADLPYPH
jgi:hypothetical protein